MNFIVPEEQILTVELRPHQIEAVEALATAAEQYAYAEMSVASGKSLVMAALAKRALPQTRALIIAHTEDLVEQNARACRWLGLKPAICSSALRETAVYGHLTVGTIGTIVKRVDYFKNVGVVIIDEVHRARMEENKDGSASQYLKLKEALPNAWFRGLTGTGWREDGTGSLEHSFGAKVFEYGFAQALEDGFVKPLRAVAAKAPAIDTKGLKTNSAGEWSGTELTNRGVALAPAHAAAFLDAMAEEERTRALVFACDIEHADALEAECKKLGHDARAVHTANGGRGGNVEAFRRGDFPVLISVAMFNTGFDVPDIDFIALCRPMKSKLLYAQSLGRGARLSDLAADCVVVDFGGNILRHGALDMLRPPKRREANDTEKDPSVEPAPSGVLYGCPHHEDVKRSEPGFCPECGTWLIELAIDKVIGGDLRTGAEEGVLVASRSKPRWVKPKGDPSFLVGRRLWKIPTEIGPVTWLSPSYPLDARFLYCEYGRGGWVARGVVDSAKVLHKA